MFRVHAILKGLHRCRLFLFANVCELRLSGKYVRSQTVSFVLLWFQVYEQIAKRPLRDVSIRFFGKLPTARIHLPSQNGKLTGISAETDSAITRLVSKKTDSAKTNSAKTHLIQQKNDGLAKTDADSANKN